MRNTYNNKPNYSNNKIIPNQNYTNEIMNTDPSYYAQTIVANQNNYYPNNQGANMAFSKALTKKKGRGILDMSSPGNKDILTDSDSEGTSNRNYKNIEIANKNMYKKNGCAKLIIEKIESQGPQRNEEYYKFTNQKNLDRKKNDFSYNKRYNNKRIIRASSPQTEVNVNSYNYTEYNNNTINIGDNTNFNYNNIPRNNNYINPRNNNVTAMYRKLNNSQNRNLDTDPNIQDNFNYYNNMENNNKYNSNYNPYGNLYMSQGRPIKFDYPIRRSPYMNKSPQNNINKGHALLLNNPKKKYSYNDTDYNTAVTPVSYSGNSYPHNKTITMKNNYTINQNPPKNPPPSFNNYKDLAKRTTMNQLINLNYNINNNKTNLQNKFNEKLIKNVTRIQSF